MGAGAEIHLDILRAGKEKNVTITLGELPDEFGGQITLDEYDEFLGGITVAPLNELTREKFEINEKVGIGVVITKIVEESTAQEAGLRPGDVILEVNRHDVTSVDEFVKAYKKPKNSLLMLIYRQGSTFYLVMRK